MEEIESFLNWGFNPSLIKGEYFILSSASTDNDVFPFGVRNVSLLLTGDELIDLWNNERVIRNGEGIDLSIYHFKKSRYIRILGYYEERAMEAETIDELHSLIKKIQEFDMNKWVKNFKLGDYIYDEWSRNLNEDWAEDVEYALFSANYNYITIDIRETTLEMSWATNFLIRRIKI